MVGDSYVSSSTGLSFFLICVRPIGRGLTLDCNTMVPHTFHWHGPTYTSGLDLTRG